MNNKTMNLENEDTEKRIEEYIVFFKKQLHKYKKGKIKEGDFNSDFANLLNILEYSEESEYYRQVKGPVYFTSVYDFKSKDYDSILIDFELFEKEFKTKRMWGEGRNKIVDMHVMI